MGKAFTDKHGQPWKPKPTAAKLNDIRRRFNIDLFSEVGMNQIAADIDKKSEQLCDNGLGDESARPLLFEVVYLLCQEDADEKGITVSDFCNRLSLDSLDDMSEALICSLATFAEKERRRQSFFCGGRRR